MATARTFGVDVVGDIPWGTHLCLFYETKDDLVDILVPYFAEGLKSNEACMWVTSKPLEHDEAFAALAKVVPNLNQFVESGQLLMLPYTEWHMKGGTFDADRVNQGWLEKEQEALSRGFEGLRLAGNTWWIERDLWDTFTDYEEAVNAVIGEHRMIAVCPYSLEKCVGTDVVDVIRNHVGTIIKQAGTWSVVEDVTRREEAERALAREHEKVLERSEELALMNEELEVSNEELRHETAERTRAEKESLKNAERAAVLNNIIHVLNEAPDLPALYEDVLIQTITQLGFDRGLIGFATETGGFVVPRSHNVTPQLIDVAKRASLDDNVIARTLFLEQKLVAYDETPPEMPAHRDRLRGAFVGIPVLSQGETVGCILLNTDERRSFTRDDRELFQTIGLEFGTAVAKLKSREILKRELAINSSVARLSEPLLSPSSDLTALTLAILGEAKQLTDSTHGFVAFIDPGTKDVLSYGHTQMMLDVCAITQEQRKARFPIGPDGRYHPLWGYPLNEKKGFFTNAPSQHPASTGAPEGHITLKNFLAVPALLGGEAVGEIALANSHRDYTQRDVEAMERLAEVYALTLLRMRAEESTKEQAELINLASDAIVVRDLDHCVRFWNKGAEALFGWTSDEAVGKRVPTLLHTVYPISFEAAHTELLKTGSWQAEARVTTKAGTMRFIALTWTLRRDEEGDPVAILSIAHDITERYHAEAELKRYSGHLEAIVEERTVQLKDAERLAGIGETAAMIGHDLRNPLQGLQYITDLQKLRFERMPAEKRDEDDWQREQALFDRIGEQVFYMDKIVADLQDYARPLDPERETVPVRALIHEVMQSLPHADGVEIHTQLLDLTIDAEPHLMHRVFSNLVLNALQAMPDGGTLTITAAANDGSVAIAVHDTGIGIPEGMKDKLFSPLATGKAKGTGLGLAVVKRIVDAHEGSVTFESEEGAGTTFTVTLPQTAE